MNITMEINDENIIKEITDAITDLSVEVKQEIAVTAIVEILKSGQFSEEMKELQISIVEYLLKDGRYQKIIVNALTSAVLKRVYNLIS